VIKPPIFFYIRNFFSIVNGAMNSFEKCTDDIVLIPEDGFNPRRQKGSVPAVS